MLRRLSGILVLLAFASPLQGSAGRTVKLDGYAEWWQGNVLIVEGQRVRAAKRVDFKGKRRAYAFDAIPLGYEVKVEGTRAADGTVVAYKIEAKPNGRAMFEGDLSEAFDQIEQSWRRRGYVYEEGSRGQRHYVGKLYESGADVARVRGIAERLVPPYLTAEEFRVYVVDNPEWNAMAAPNGSVYVFSGLLDDMDDDEVAIVLGHEMAHATHEHSRRQYKQGLWIQMAMMGGITAAQSAIGSRGGRDMVGTAAMLGGSAWSNSYSRAHEDQADRVGLRYAHEGGYDVGKAPNLWRRFARKYGSQNGVANFFFSGHSDASDRARNMEKEVAINYPSR